MEAFERLSGKRKDFTSLHVRQVFSLQKKETGRYIKLPGNIQAVRSYGGVRLEKTVSGPGTTEGVSAEKKGSGNPAEMFFEIPLSGICLLYTSPVTTRRNTTDTRFTGKMAHRSHHLMIQGSWAR